MHVADALVSTPVAMTAAGVAAVLIGVAGTKIRKNERTDLAPLMGVTGAFVFAAQMINFSIPGTGSSGHIVGGVLLAALLGPWAAFITLASVLIIQCLVFADGGLLALGCNIINMGVMSTLVAYPLVFRPMVKNGASGWRIMVASVAACVIGLELGAMLVTGETELSGITALPTKVFLGFMTGIHLLIGIVEGLATGAVLLYVKKVRPSLLYNIPESRVEDDKKQMPLKKLILIIGVAALLVGGVLSFFASSDPDGLEWSIMKITDSTELEGALSTAARTAERVQTATAVLPDYQNVLSGVIGATMVLMLVWAFTSLLSHKRAVAGKMKHKQE